MVECFVVVGRFYWVVKVCLPYTCSRASREAHEGFRNFRIVDPPLRHKLVRVFKYVSVHVASERRYAVNRPGRNEVLYTSCPVYVYDSVIGAHAYLAVHCAWV